MSGRGGGNSKQGRGRGTCPNRSNGGIYNSVPPPPDLHSNSGQCPSPSIGARSADFDLEHGGHHSSIRYAGSPNHLRACDGTPSAHSGSGNRRRTPSDPLGVAPGYSLPVMSHLETIFLNPRICLPSLVFVEPRFADVYCVRMKDNTPRNDWQHQLPAQIIMSILQGCHNTSSSAPFRCRPWKSESQATP